MISNGLERQFILATQHLRATTSLEELFVFEIISRSGASKEQLFVHYV
jgi:hypothetical protein